LEGIDFTSALNPEQHAAATAPDGPILVLAAAGTGKTRTIVYRVAYLVEKGIPADRILLLTFTNRAAREMLERARGLVGASVGGIWGGTFHHMANRILRIHAADAGYPPHYAILDRDDSENLIGECLKDLNLNHKEFPKSDVLMSLFSAAANTETPLGEMLERRMGHEAPDPAEVLRVREAYRDRKRKVGAMDFDDLLGQCLALFRNRDDLAGRYADRFLHILVDEYQDTNLIQAELVDRLAARNRNLLVVGDDFQSIYSWRGADFQNILTFPKRYPDARVCLLETNYRSVPEILGVANACIAGNPEQFQKTLRAVRENHVKPVLARMRDGGEQARYVVEQIRNLRRAGHRYRDIAVLYRAHFHAMELQIGLSQEAIPYVVTSGIRFFEQAHIKDVCSVVRILANPADGLAFGRLLRLFPGVGERTAARVWEGLGGRFEAGDAAARARLRESLPAAARPSWDRVEPVLAAWFEENLREDCGEAIHRFVRSFYEKHAAAAFEDFARRLEDIAELILYTARFESPEGFLSDVALFTNLDAEEEDLATQGGDAVRLSTVHQAKGLEWPAVFVLWLTDNMFPSPRTVCESPAGEAEERRLFYVAVTRAKDELYLCVPEIRRRRDGGTIPCPPSRFVREIPSQLLRLDRVGFI
jgi:DNA helicase-2/ATP-dependent DNA helicase PcrA